jgi:hypothetical protein
MWRRPRGDSSSFLSGRFSSEGIRFRNSLSSHFPVYQTSSGPRLPYFLEKVSDTSFPRFPVREGTGWSKATPVKTFSLRVHQSRWGSTTGRIGTRASQTWEAESQCSWRKTYSSCRTTSPRLVDSQGKCFDRCSFASPSSFSNSVYRFQSSGMGSLSRGKVYYCCIVRR